MAAAGLILNAAPGAMTGAMKFADPGAVLLSRSSPLRLELQPLMFWTRKTEPLNVFSWKFLNCCAEGRDVEHDPAVR